MEIAALIISIISIGFAFLTWVLNIRENKAPNCNVKMSHTIVQVEGQKYVQLNIAVENLGTGNITIEKARVFLNEGNIANDDILFDDLRTHKKENEDCDLSLHIKDTEDAVYPDMSGASKVRISKNIVALTDALAYLYPKQVYETSMIFTLPKHAVYEAMTVLIFQTKYHNDCTCATHIIDFSKEMSYE